MDEKGSTLHLETGDVKMVRSKSGTRTGDGNLLTANNRNSFQLKRDNATVIE